MLQLGCLAELAEHGDAGRTDAEVEVGQARDRRVVPTALGMERCRGDREPA